MSRGNIIPQPSKEFGADNGDSLVVDVLPRKVGDLMPHRPPMRFIARLLARDRQEDTALAEAVIPDKDSFFWTSAGLLPEYLLELLAQTMAAGNGFDALQDGVTATSGFLVGVEDFQWEARPQARETVQIAMRKTFKFGSVTIMHGQIEGAAGLLAQGKVKVWEVGS